MSYPPREGDLTTQELLARTSELMTRNPNVRIYVKWTCPACGERVMSGEPNVFNAGGYVHDDPNCGFHYTGEYWGFMAEFSNPVGKGETDNS